MLTLTSSEAQNTFGNVIDKSQREIVSVTRRGRIATLVMSPEVLEDYVDGRMALEAQARGMLTIKKQKNHLINTDNARNYYVKGGG